MFWQTSRFQIDLTRPKIMGIVNVTPDSFSDGGRYAHFGSAIQHAEQLVKDGADILDLGGESSRPGATVLPLHLELERILPVLVEVLNWGVRHGG
jgi:dihydropteroate synthase